MRTLNVKITDEMHEQIRRAAYRATDAAGKRVSMAEIVRRAIEAANERGVFVEIKRRRRGEAQNHHRIIIKNKP